MRAVGVIPARVGAGRFPGKALAPIAGLPMIRRVFEGAQTAKTLRAVLIATDDARIADAARAFGATEVEEIEAKSRVEAKRHEAEAEAEATKLRQEADAEAARLQAEAEARAYAERQKSAEVLEAHPALLRLAELETLRDLAQNANARIYLGFERGGLHVDGAEDQRDAS